MEVNSTTTTDPVNYYNNLNNFIMNPMVFIIVLLIIISFFVLSSSLGNKDSSSASDGNGQNIMGVIIVAILVVLIIVNALQYFFSISVTAYLNDIFTNKPKIDIVVDQSTYQAAPVPEIRFKKQVFNIPGNYYSYDNAKALCQAYGSNLATYKQIENSYRNGGEWCNYGWSDGQMALFPTQQSTFNNLQNIQGHEHDCGRRLQRSKQKSTPTSRHRSTQNRLFQAGYSTGNISNTPQRKENTFLRHLRDKANNTNLPFFSFYLP